MAQYCREGKRWTQYDTAQNIATQNDTVPKHCRITVYTSRPTVNSPRLM